MKSTYLSIFCALFLYTTSSHALPTVNLGSSNILDGGPTRPNPGWYWVQVSRYYTADNFFDHCGDAISECPLPFNILSTTTQFIYQSKRKLRNKITLGFDATLPFILYARIAPNHLGFVSRGAGVGDLALGTFLQWDPIMRHGHPLFVQRLELVVSSPTGKRCDDLTRTFINPGNGVFFINPYWAATLYFSPSWAVSWRLHYLWCSENRKTGIQPGQAIHANYSFEHQITKDFWGAIVGYFLKQITDNKSCSVPIPRSRERIFAVGPGALYVFPHEWLLFGYVYYEALARNRTQGICGVLKILKHF